MSDVVRPVKKKPKMKTTTVMMPLRPVRDETALWSRADNGYCVTGHDKYPGEGWFKVAEFPTLKQGMVAMETLIAERDGELPTCETCGEIQAHPMIRCADCMEKAVAAFQAKVAAAKKKGKKGK